MPFLFAACWRLGAENVNHLPMDKKFKLSYEPPKVTAVTFKVEVGQVASTTLDMLPLSTFGDGGTWDGPSTSSSTSHFGDGDWSSGSSFSNNSTFGSGSWDN